MRPSLCLVVLALLASASAEYSASLKAAVNGYRSQASLLSAILEKSIAREDNLCVGHNDCCQPSQDGPCGLGEGDCDGDAECIDGLVCGECEESFDVPGIDEMWVIEEANFSQSDKCCRIPEGAFE